MSINTNYNNVLLSDKSGGIFNIEFPEGMIVIWNGTKQNVPRGWGLCDGTKQTPDLRGKFIRMYSDDSNLQFDQISNIILNDKNRKIQVEYAEKFAGFSSDGESGKKRNIFKHGINEKGGSDTFYLSEVELPAHTHDISWNGITEWSVGNSDFWSGSSGETIFESGSGSGILREADTSKKFSDVVKITRGSNEIIQQNNQPPYYVLSFIMKLKISNDILLNNKPENLLSGNNNLLLANPLGDTIMIGFPRGMIVIWSGTRENVPLGWALCDGKDGITPDLRGQFVRMYSDDLNDRYFTTETSYISQHRGISRGNTSGYVHSHRIGDKGGTDLQISDPKEIPAHTHNIDWAKASQWGYAGDKWRGATRGGASPLKDSSTQNFSNAGVTILPNGRKNPNPQNNQPPYYVLAFIMKL